MTREDIKAAREKSDRDMKLDTKRPWDGMNLKTFTSGEPEVPSKPKDKTE